jgi:starch synthase
VRATGGLADTVADFDPDRDAGTGFVFVEYSAEALRGALLRALDTYRDREAWQGLVQRGMHRDFSWSASARRYEALYADALAYHAAEPH